MVEFAGYSLPVLYEKDNGGVMAEHFQARERAGIFDVSHMGQIKWHGDDCADFIEKCVVGDIKGLEVGVGVDSIVVSKCFGLLFWLTSPLTSPLPSLPPSCSPELDSSPSSPPLRGPSLTTASFPGPRR